MGSRNQCITLANVLRATLFLGVAFGQAAFRQDAAAQQPTQAAIAQALRSTDTVGVRAAVEEMVQIPVAQQGPELRAAVVDLLAQEGEARTWRGNIVESLTNAVLEIAQTGDPVAIPALAAFPAAGWEWYRALVSFGDPALRAVLAAASSPTSDHGTQMGALETLEMFVDEWGLEGFDAPTYQRMKDLVARRLEGPTHFGVLHSSIGVAILLEDPVLRSRVEELAASDEAVRAHGIGEADLIEFVRKEAAERLVDPRPPWQKAVPVLRCVLWTARSAAVAGQTLIGCVGQA